MRHIPPTMIHVAASSPFAASTLAGPVGRVPDEVLEIRANNARNVIADAIKLSDDGVEGDGAEVHGEVCLGRPVPTLVDRSKEAGPRVVGCHGRTGLRERLLGSVSTALLHHAHCPVAVVHDETLTPR